jgi:hypothetical protein
VNGAINTTPSQESDIRRIDNHIDVQSRDVTTDGVDSTSHLSPNGRRPDVAALEHRLPPRMIVSESDP